MKKMKLKEIQDVSLNVLEEFHNFCEVNGLRYSLAYGTLIGAVRHQGFIPWDDDVDVMMPRPDYDKFVTSYRDNENYACFADERKNCFIAYARLAEMKRTFIKPASVWANKDTGIWIDIFPIDGVESDFNLFSKNVEIATKLWRNVYLGRDAISSFSSCLTISRKMTWPIKKLIYGKSVYRYLYKHLEICHRFDYESSSYVSNISILISTIRAHFNKKMFEEYIELPFENLKLKSIKDYHINLTMIYGDYMQLPPEDKRINHTMHDFFWK